MISLNNQNCINLLSTLLEYCGNCTIQIKINAYLFSKGSKL